MAIGWGGMTGYLACIREGIRAVNSFLADWAMNMNRYYRGGAGDDRLVKLGGFAVRFDRRAVKLCSLDVMWLGHEPISSWEIAPQRALLNFLAVTSVQRQARNLLKYGSRDRARRRIQLLDIRHPCVDSDPARRRSNGLMIDDGPVSFTTVSNRRNCPRPVRLGVRWSRPHGR